jgi:hypothetical protein
VLSNGNSNAFIASIPIGGQLAPNSTVGESALWKYAQKIAKKNKASEIINIATPILRPFCTANVWLPKYVPSEITSLNHNDILAINRTNVAGNHNPDASNPCMFETADVVKVNKLIHVKRGQGEGETRWKGWPWKLLRFCIDIIIFFMSWIQFENCIMRGL